METGVAGAFAAIGVSSVTVALCDVEAAREASKAVTVMLLMPGTRGIPLACQTPFVIVAEPL
jgi:hypothetical protein